MISFFTILVYASGYLALLIAALCMACGLYYFAEMAEEHTSLAKKIIKYILQMVIVFHLILLVYERFPPLYVLLGLAAHASYLNLLRTFPIIEPLSVPFMASVGMFVISNIGWFYMFKTDYELMTRYALMGGPSVSAFFATMVWSAPVGLFVSLTVNDSMLPGAASSKQTSFSLGGAGGSGRSNLVSVVINVVAYYGRLAYEKVFG